MGIRTKVILMENFYRKQRTRLNI
jgi:hypothetical protein